MNLSQIATFAIVAVSATFLGGCQDAELSECQEENLRLQSQVQGLTEQVAAGDKAQIGSLRIISDLNAENLKLTKQVGSLKKALSQTPEQRARLQKGLRELREMQRKSAERMKKEALENKAGQ